MFGKLHCYSLCIFLIFILLLLIPLHDATNVKNGRIAKRCCNHHLQWPQQISSENGLLDSFDARKLVMDHLQSSSLSALIVLLLSVSISATVPADLLCSYGGVSYSNADNIPHPNGCTLMQCQFGQVVAYWEACSTEIDGKCHAVGSSFIHNDITYDCRKTVEGGEPVYTNVRITPEYVGCDVEGGWYEHLEKFELSDGCLQYQCQNGKARVIGQACDVTLDGQCHPLGTWYKKDSNFYKCTREGETSGDPVYKHTLLAPQPNPNIYCILGGVDYANLQTMTTGNGCNKRQCQSGAMPHYLTVCQFWRDGGKCYLPGEMWEFEKKLWECRNVIENGVVTDSVRSQTDDPSYLSCWLSETLYRHLDTMVVDNGCGLRQCQDGTVPYLQLGCQHLGVCRPKDSLWVLDGITFKCIVTSYGYRKVVRVDAYGQFDEGTKPQPPELGPPPPYEGCPAVADIIFLIDASRSMSLATFHRELDFAVAVCDYFKLGPDDIKIGAVVFSTTAQIVFHLNAHTNRESLTNAISSTPFLQDKTRTDLALDLVLDQNMFGTENGGRDDADNIIILMTDGDSDDTAVTIQAADRVKAQDISIITVGVGFIHTDELMAVASRFENAFFAPTFEVLEDLLSGVSRRACDAADACADDPCEHFCDGMLDTFVCSCREGFQENELDPTQCDDIDECSASPCEHTCENTEGSYECSCDEGYLVSVLNPDECRDINECTSSAESPCEQVCDNLPGSYTCSCNEGYVVDPNNPDKCLEINQCETQADIILLFDASSSIGIESFQKQFDFAKRLFRHFTIGDEDVLFAALVFSYHTQILFYLNENKNYTELDQAVSDVGYMNSSTYTHVALQYVYTYNMFSTEKGGRDDAKDVIILITDGNANRQSSTRTMANYLKNQGVTIMAIAIGPEITLDKLEEIVSTPEDIVQATSYDELHVIEQKVADLACGPRE